MEVLHTGAQLVEQKFPLILTQAALLFHILKQVTAFHPTWRNKRKTGKRLSWQKFKEKGRESDSQFHEQIQLILEVKDGVETNDISLVQIFGAEAGEEAMR